MTKWPVGHPGHRRHENIIRSQIGTNGNRFEHVSKNKCAPMVARINQSSVRILYANSLKRNAHILRKAKKC
jgi:hypothetical protein